MEISSIVSHYLNPSEFGPQQELKPLKTPASDQDVQRFEAIMSGDGPFQPKSLDLVAPPTEKNAIQNVSETVIDGVSNIKQSVDARIDRMNQMFQKEELNIADMMNLQWQVSMFSVESSLIAKSGDKVSDGIKTLFRNQ